MKTETDPEANASDTSDSDTSDSAPSDSDADPESLDVPENAAVPFSDDKGPRTNLTAYERLDSRWIGLNRLINLISASIVGAILLALGIGLFWVVPAGWNLLIPLAWAALVGLSLLSIVWWPRWDYEHWGYRADDQIVELRFGVVWRVSVSIPLSRIQHVDLHRGPLERRWGLASLQIHTAGTREASHTIAGLDYATAAALRDRLIETANRGSDERPID